MFIVNHANHASSYLSLLSHRNSSIFPAYPKLPAIFSGDPSPGFPQGCRAPAPWTPRRRPCPRATGTPSWHAPNVRRRWAPSASRPSEGSWSRGWRGGTLQPMGNIRELCSFDCFKGKPAGNHRFYHQVYGCPVDFPIKQFYDIWEICGKYVRTMCNIWRYSYSITKVNGGL